MSTTLEKLTLLIRDVFDNDDVVATPELTAREVNGWDSLGNVRLFLEIEKAFSVSFSALEIALTENVGEIVKLIERKSVSS
jgi:acyl carrier protein